MIELRKIATFNGSEKEIEEINIAKETPEIL